MRCYAVTENGKPLQPMEFPTPEPVGEQVLIEVTHCGVCHSDLHIWEGGYDMGGGKRLSLKDRGVTLPVVMGHEIVGRVARLGPDAEGRGLKPGTPYAVFPWLGCGTCAACRSEDDNMCAVKPAALGVYAPGGYGSHVIVPSPRHLVDISGLDPAVAATYSCSGITVYSAIAKVMPMEPDEPLVLIGAGGLGLNAISILKALDHRNIVVVDTSPTKRDAAMAAGATQVVDGAGDPEAVTKRIVEACGGPVLAVIDLVNASSTTRSAFDALRKGGRLILVGLFGGELTLPLPIMPTRALTVRGSYVGSPKELRALIGLVRQGKVAPLPVRTEPVANINAVLNDLLAGNIVGRVVVTQPAA
jgi:alcohol dehydrogenase/propanol-preferring alcohol dehydrogenase